MKSSSVTETSKIENDLNVPPGNILTIEWDMLDKSRFYPYFILCSLLSRVAIYPNQLIRTRLQLQHQKDEYKGTADAYKKIVTKEGMWGLYRGFWFGTLYLVPGLTFVTTYERTRHFLEVNGVSDTRVKAMIGGGCAAAVSQTMFVPLDIISQHMMVKSMPSKTNTRWWYVARAVNSMDVIKNIYRRDGCKGFYRGYRAIQHDVVDVRAVQRVLVDFLPRVPGRLWRLLAAFAAFQLPADLSAPQRCPGLGWSSGQLHHNHAPQPSRLGPCKSSVGENVGLGNLRSSLEDGKMGDIS